MIILFQLVEFQSNKQNCSRPFNGQKRAANSGMNHSFLFCGLIAFILIRKKITLEQFRQLLHKIDVIRIQFPLRIQTFYISNIDVMTQ